MYRRDKDLSYLLYSIGRPEITPRSTYQPGGVRNGSSEFGYRGIPIVRSILRAVYLPAATTLILSALSSLLYQPFLSYKIGHAQSVGGVGNGPIELDTK